jgi:hypothetical protein
MGWLGTGINDWYRRLGWENAGCAWTFTLDRATIELLPPLEAPKVDEDGKRIHPKERGRAKKRLQSIRAMERLKAWRDAS